VVAWAVEFEGEPEPFCLSFDKGKAIDEAGGVGKVFPLYRSPTLTDAERGAIERLCEAVTEYSDIDRKENGCHADDDMAAVAVARGLMKRMV
jgi:hypothetical protein